MKIIIQCAASKAPGGYFLTSAGQPIKFLARPAESPPNPPYLFARPDDLADVEGRTWRDLVSAYNATTNANAFGLSRAYHLYSNRVYTALVERFGTENVYILSAGWGLIRSDFLTPQYDITFSSASERFNRRKHSDHYADFCHLDGGNTDQILFFGGRDYLPLFCRLTSNQKPERVVFFNSRIPPSPPNCRLVKYETNTRTNWHYACVADFLSGRLEY